MGWSVFVGDFVITWAALGLTVLPAGATAAPPCPNEADVVTTHAPEYARAHSGMLLTMEGPSGALKT